MEWLARNPELWMILRDFLPACTTWDDGEGVEVLQQRPIKDRGNELESRLGELQWNPMEPTEVKPP